MADSATTRKRLRKQSLGSNTNTWGDTKLNEVLDVIDQCMDGWVQITLTGNLDLTAFTTNYTLSDNTKYRSLTFLGSPAAGCSVTFPSVQCWYLLINSTTQTVTALCSGGTGVGVPAGGVALVYGDGTDIRNGAPQLVNGALTINGQLHGVATPSINTDAANKLYVDTAVANGAFPAAPGSVRVDSNDTTAGVPTGKFNFTGAGAVTVTTSISNPSGNEVWNIIYGAGSLALTDGGSKVTAFNALSNYRYRVDATGGSAYTITGPAAPATQRTVTMVIVEFAGALADCRANLAAVREIIAHSQQAN